MFTYEQSIRKNHRKSLKKAGLAIGMSFAKPVQVKNRFTYKEFSLIAGILVALIIVFTLWIRSEPLHPTPGALKNNPKRTLTLPELAKSFVTKTLAEIHF